MSDAKPARCPNPGCGSEDTHVAAYGLLPDFKTQTSWKCFCAKCRATVGYFDTREAALAAWAKMGEWREPKAEPRVDYFYDPRFDEISTHWDDRYDYMIDRDYDEVIEVTAVVEVGTKWLARVVLSWDEDGETDEWDVLAFDSEAEAKAAVLANKPPKEEA